MHSRQRYIELDILRTLAIGGMILYHTAYDLSHFYGWDIDVFDGGWKWLQIITASLFLGLVGVGASISHRHPFRRFCRIGAAALLVTVVTYVIDPQTFVRFGVLHVIAVAALVMPCMGWVGRRTRRTSLQGAIAMIVMGLCIIMIESFMDPWHIDGAWRFIGIPLGIPPHGFSTVDYYPLVPWLGVVLIGYGMGSILFTRFAHQTKFLIEANKLTSYEAISWPGRHSLLLYLLHQPIIIGILWILLGPPEF